VATLTPKGEQTRQQILVTALHLFIERGYDATTMRDIAAATNRSLGLTYRYFERKEELVMALYQQLSGEFVKQVDELPAAPLAAQFERAMLSKLALLAPYKNILGSLFGAAMNPQSAVSVLGEGTAQIRYDVRGAYERLFMRATDAPRHRQIGQLATTLYGAHLAVILFWLYERDTAYPMTRNLLGFIREALTLGRPVLGLPPISNALDRLARIVGTMIGWNETEPETDTSPRKPKSKERLR
jgi:AcrR family transcriptional regulator